MPSSLLRSPVTALMLSRGGHVTKRVVQFFWRVRNLLSCLAGRDRFRAQRPSTRNIPFGHSSAYMAHSKTVRALKHRVTAPVPEHKPRKVEHVVHL